MPPATANKPATAKADKPEKVASPFTVLRPVDPESVTRNGSAPDDADAPAAEPLKLYEVVGEYTSKTSKGAIALAIGEHGGGTYVAVPKRSFVERAAEPVAAPRLNWK